MKKKSLKKLLIIDDLGAVLKKHRRNSKVTQKQIAELAGLSENYISCLERGIYHMNAKTLLIYIKCCDVNIDDLIKEV